MKLNNTRNLKQTLKILKLLGYGYTVPKVCATLGVPYFTVADWARRSGMPITIASRGRKCGPVNGERLEKMRELRAEGLTLSQIGRRFRVTKQCVDQYLKTHSKRKLLDIGARSR